MFHYVTDELIAPRYSIFLIKLAVSGLIKKLPPFVETDGSLQCSYKHALYCEPAESGSLFLLKKFFRFLVEE
jgi:hypothetical protein